MLRTYDYVIVGSGSAGAVVASRLSEDKDISVVLIEAGGRDRHPYQSMPLAFLKVAHHPHYNWGFETEQEPGLGGRQLPVPRGKTLGGSSSVNALIAIRGNPRDYDLWRQQGLDGWGYADVLPYFRRLENHWRGETAYHGAGGPIQITPMLHPDNLFQPLQEAARNLGIPVNDDPNGAAQEGVGRMEATIGRGRRSSTARAYLHPAMRRPNLTVETNALATRILLEGGRAVGVEYLKGGQAHQLHAAREVILSGGAYGSPQLLLLSGIGPADELAALGIQPVHDLPGVGRNLHDHPNILNIFRMREAAGLTRHLRFDRATLQAARWLLTRQGVFGQNGGAANIFLRSGSELERPDLQLTVMAVSNSAELWFPGMTRPPTYCFNIRIGNLHPQSRGWVRLRSADPVAKPRILNNMYAVESDLDVMVKGIEICRALYATSPLRELVEGEIVPGADLTDKRELGQFIRANGGHRSHPVGTCRMGIDAEAVVDATLKLRGIDGLRVADASIMPDVPSGNTNLPSIMIGEKAADLIRGRSLPPALV